MRNGTLLRVEGLEKGFDGRSVLRGMDLAIDPGMIYGLLGSNGAGKTTAINIITGLLTPDGGSVRMDGGPPGGDWRARLGVAPQDVALYPRLSCAENIAFFASLYGVAGRRLEARVNEMIEVAQLSDYRDVYVSKLSGGTRRRLNLAVALAHRPELVILDEPTAGLDIDARYGVWEIIRGLRTEGASVLLTTHLLDEAASLCDRIAILHEGRIAREGTLDNLCASVPAVQIAEIASDEDDLVRARALESGMGVRRQGRRLALLLKDAVSLESLVEHLRGTGVRSVSLRPVNLEDVFFDATEEDSEFGIQN